MNKNLSKKYLIISPSWLGDLIMSQSLLKELKKQDHNCTIDVYAPAYTMPILDRMEEISGKLINPFDHGSLNIKERFKEGRKLASEPDKVSADTALELLQEEQLDLVEKFRQKVSE